MFSFDLSLSPESCDEDCLPVLSSTTNYADLSAKTPKMSKLGPQFNLNDNDDTSSSTQLAVYSNPINQLNNLNTKSATIGTGMPTVNRPNTINDSDACSATNFSESFVLKNNLSELCKEFGKFKLFNQVKSRENKIESISAGKFISKLEQFIKCRYGSDAFSEIPSIFHYLLDISLYKWYFKLSNQVMGNYDEFKRSFTAHCADLEYEYSSMVFLSKTKFLLKLKGMHNSVEFDNLVDKHPMLTYFNERIKLLNDVHPNMPVEDMIKVTLILLEDKKLYLSLKPLIHNLQALKFNLDMLDEEEQARKRNAGS